MMIMVLLLWFSYKNDPDGSDDDYDSLTRMFRMVLMIVLLLE
jgi:hypothetical protein